MLHYTSLRAGGFKSSFQGPGARARLIALGDVDGREKEAVRVAKATRAAKDQVTATTLGLAH